MKNIIKWLIAAVIFIFGVVVGSSNNTQLSEVDLFVSKDLARCRIDLTNYKRLKEVDDYGFDLSASLLSETSELFTAITNEDYITASQIMQRVVNYRPKVNIFVEQRRKVLTELGY